MWFIRRIRAHEVRLPRLAPASLLSIRSKRNAEGRTFVWIVEDLQAPPLTSIDAFPIDGACQDRLQQKNPLRGAGLRPEKLFLVFDRDKLEFLADLLGLHDNLKPAVRFSQELFDLFVARLVE